MDDRKLWVDYAKAIGIVLVVYGHVARGVFNAGMELPVGLYELADNIIYSFHMPLFFVLSGLFFYRSFSKGGGRQLLTKKIDTIVYPFILWSVLQGTIEVVLSNYTTASVTFSEVFSLLWQPRAQFWFLYALFFCFAVATVIFTLVRTYNAALLTFAVAVVVYFYRGLLPEGMAFTYISNNLVYFAAGILVSRYLQTTHLTNVNILTVAFLSFIIAQTYFNGILGMSYETTSVPTLMVALLSVFFIMNLAAYGAKRPNRWILLIGQSSMAIYLSHILVGSGARIALQKVLGIESAYIHLVIGSLAGILLPMVFFLVVKRFKIPYVFSAPIGTGIATLLRRAQSKLTPVRS